jgi:hypothetical protein
MSKFRLKETTVNIRENAIRVRELTHAERLRWVKEAGEDHFRGPGLLVSLGAVNPAFTEEEVGELPADVVTELTTAIMKLSGMSIEKQPDARGDVPVPTLSGVRSAAQ